MLKEYDSSLIDEINEREKNLSFIIKAEEDTKDGGIIYKMLTQCPVWYMELCSLINPPRSVSIYTLKQTPSYSLLQFVDPSHSECPVRTVSVGTRDCPVTNLRVIINKFRNR